MWVRHRPGGAQRKVKMDDKEQAAIDSLRAAGLEDEATAVEEIRAMHRATIDAYHAGLRDSFKNGRSAERDVWRSVARQLEVSHTGMSYGDEKRGEVVEYTRGWGDCLAALKKMAGLGA